MTEKEILNELKDLQKAISKHEFCQERQDDDCGFHPSGIFISSKVVKSRVSKLINKITNPKSDK